MFCGLLFLLPAPPLSYLSSVEYNTSLFTLFAIFPPFFFGMFYPRLESRTPVQTARTPTQRKGELTTICPHFPFSNHFSFTSPPSLCSAAGVFVFLFLNTTPVSSLSETMTVQARDRLRYLPLPFVVLPPHIILNSKPLVEDVASESATLCCTIFPGEGDLKEIKYTN